MQYSSWTNGHLYWAIYICCGQFAVVNLCGYKNSKTIKIGKDICKIWNLNLIKVKRKVKKNKKIYAVFKYRREEMPKIYEENILV